MRRYLSLFVAFVMIAASLTTVQVVVSSTAAQAAANTNLITGSNFVELADNARLTTHSSSVTKGFVAASNDEVAIAQATAAANHSSSTIIISASTTDPANVNAIVQQKGITSLTFVGTEAAFPATFRDAIHASVTTKTAVLSNSPFERSKNLVPSGMESFVFVKNSDVTGMSAAVAYSSATSSALMVITGTEPANTVKTYVSVAADPVITLIGDLGISDQFKQEDADSFLVVDLATEASLDQFYQAVVQMFVDRKDRAVTKIVTAPRNSLTSFALATAVAQTRGAIVVPAGDANAVTANSPLDRYLKLLKNETTEVTLVGVSATAAQLNAIASPTSTTRETSPAWTVTNAMKGTSSYTLSYTARAGAASYSALDWDNTTQIGTSNTTSMIIPGAPDFATLIAYDASGAEIDRMYFRSNDYQTATDRESVVIGTIRNGVADVRILGTSGVPRKIVRVYTDIFAGLDQPLPTPETVAITCSNTFTDTNLTKSYEWTYQVSTLTTKTGVGCGAPAGATISGGLTSISGLQLPYTEEPAWNVSLRREGDDPSETTLTPTGMVMPSPGQTLSDAAREQMAVKQEAAVESDKSAKTATSLAVGSGYVFTYLGYIPEEVVPLPFPSGDLQRPLAFFNGSGRGYWDVNSIHNKFSIRATVGNSSVSVEKHIGETLRYHCGPVQPNCVLAARATASLSDLTFSSLVQAGKTSMKFTVNSPNPLQPFAPPINGSLNVELTSRAWTLKGTHDLMPVHQFMWGPEYSEYKISYSTHTNYRLDCLFGYPGCVAIVNTHL